jgi:DNA (cytosine-5)-methyltransferase 1
MKTLTVFDCFCGLGGLSIGATFAGLQVIAGVDADEAATNVYSNVFSADRTLNSDLLSESPRSVLKRAKIRKGDVDVLVGGPPCQPYSINNHARGTHDVRCALVEKYLQFVSILQPQWLVMENVPGFASIENGQFLCRLLRSLKYRNYNVESLILDASRFGVPQRRKRLIIIAGRKKSKLKNAVDALTEHSSPVLTVGDAFSDIPASLDDSAKYNGRASNLFQRMMRQQNTKKIQCHLAAGLGPRNLRRILHVPPGGNWRNIPRHLLPLGMKRARLSDHTTRYGRLHFSRPAFTLLTKCDPHWGCFVHPTENRVISVREAARLQSIPDYVEFGTNLSINYRLIGNAVPPLLAKAILQSIQ